MFIFCGQMIARKGIDLLVRAFSELIGQNVPARLELVGREAELPRLLAPLPEHVRDRIHFRGFLPPLDLPQAFARADVFVLPSRHDGWGVVVNQALGARLPVICSDAVGAWYDLIRSGENGEIVPAGDVDALAAAMKKLALSPELRTKYSAAAAVTAERLTPEKAAEFWENLAEKLAGPA